MCNVQQAKRMMRHARDQYEAAVDDGRTEDAQLANIIWTDAARAYVRAMRSHERHPEREASHA